MSPKKLPFTRVDELLKKTLKELNVEENFRVYPIWKNWKEIMTPAVAEKTHPDYVRGKTLIVSVVNSVWMNELEMQKNIILKRITDLKLEHPIEDIRFRMMKE